jgi:hypothetical protein
MTHTSWTLTETFGFGVAAAGPTPVRSLDLRVLKERLVRLALKVFKV